VRGDDLRFLTSEEREFGGKKPEKERICPTLKMFEPHH